MSRPIWYFDEQSHAGPEHLDRERVMAYDSKVRFDPTEDIGHLRSLGLSPESTLVDLGAGTGTLALEAARLCRRVVAVDISPAMLEIVRRRSEEAGLGNLETVEAGFLTYTHRGQSADFVYSRNALHHLPDFWKVRALSRIAATLEPGGVLLLRDLVYSFGPEVAGETIDDWLARAPVNARDGVPQAEIVRHVRDEYSTFSWLLEEMLVRTGFEIANVSYSPNQLFAAYTCLRT